MNELKQQIVYMRQAMFSKGMTRELEGFDTAIRLFADTKKKSFKQKLSEGWQKHKGKILAGAALAAAGGTGLWGYNQKNRADEAEAKALGSTIANAGANVADKAIIAQLTEQLAKAKKEYSNLAGASKEEKDALQGKIKYLQYQLKKAKSEKAATIQETGTTSVGDYKDYYYNNK